MSLETHYLLPRPGCRRLGFAGTTSCLSKHKTGCRVLAAAAWLPPGHRPAGHIPDPDEWKRLGRLLLGPLGLALGASALIQSGHAFYYVVSANAWSAQGISGAMVGALWAFAVAFEIAFLWLSGRGWLAFPMTPAFRWVRSASSVRTWS